MGFIEDTLDRLRKSIAHTVKRFTAYSMALFFLGAVYGALGVPHLAKNGVFDQFTLVLFPVVLAGLSYYFIEVATVIFVLLMVMMILFFV